MNRNLALCGTLLMLLCLGGCHPIRAVRSAGSCHDPKRPYLKADSVAPLKIPAGLDTPDNTNALHIPALNEPAPPARAATDPCLEEPPSFQVAKQAPPQA
jgi:uncharacterized lipoprotein